MVHWNECDPARIVFHANFIRWMDEGFTEFCRARGVDFAAMQRADPAFLGCPLVDVRCAFRAPARHGDVLAQEIALAGYGGGKSFRLAHRFFLPDGTLAAEGEHVRIWGREEGGALRALPVPQEFIAALG
nr:acyl-CoA thioesterase [Paracraurococcus ruber]